jgi:murein DD-endopeptidase MepM/ murein hydrolase activator NlpD
MAAPEGTRVVSAEKGVVTHVGLGRTAGSKPYGQYVDIEHVDFAIKTRYAHLSKIVPGIAQGTAVDRGQLIGFVGMTGRATGPHLHFEVMLLTPAATRIDPRPYLPGR